MVYKFYTKLWLVYLLLIKPYLSNNDEIIINDAANLNTTEKATKSLTKERKRAFDCDSEKWLLDLFAYIK